MLVQNRIGQCMNGAVNDVNGDNQVGTYDNMIPVLDQSSVSNNCLKLSLDPLQEQSSYYRNLQEVDIMINNVVCSFSVRCHLNLRNIALNTYNVEYKRENGMLSMKLRKPRITASIWSSGKITCTGASSELDAKVGARRVGRILQKQGFKTKLHNYRVVNVLGTCTMPFGIKITLFTQRYREAEYEPELHPGVTYKLKHLKATMKIYSTGSVTVTAPSVINVQRAIEHLYPLVLEFRKDRVAEEEKLELLKLKKFKNLKQAESSTISSNTSEFTEEYVEEDGNTQSTRSFIS